MACRSGTNCKDTISDEKAPAWRESAILEMRGAQLSQIPMWRMILRWKF